MYTLHQSGLVPDALQTIDSTVGRAYHQAAGAKGGLRDEVSADRGYGSHIARKTMQARNAVQVITVRKTRKLRVTMDRTLNLLCNLVERCFKKLNNAHRVATRHHKTAKNFLDFIDITSIRIWRRDLSR